MKVKNIYSTNVKADLEHIATNSTKPNYYDITQLLCIQKKEDLFDGTLGERYTEPVNLELNPNYKPFYCKNYPVPSIHKDTYRKELQLLV